MEGVPHSVVLQQRSACVLDLKRIPAVLSDCCMAHQITHTRNVVNAEKKIQREARSCFLPSPLTELTWGQTCRNSYLAAPGWRHRAAQQLPLRQGLKRQRRGGESGALLLVKLDGHVSLMVQVRNDLCGLRPLRTCESGRLRSVPSSFAGWLDSWKE